MTSMSSMFNEASAFNQDIRVEHRKVTTMYRMFYYASAFNHDISSWTGTAATTAQDDMFTSQLRFPRNLRHQRRHRSGEFVRAQVDTDRRRLHAVPVSINTKVVLL